MNAPHTTPDATKHAVTGDAKAKARSENRIAALIFLLVVLLLAAIAGVVWMFGAPMLGIVGLVGTAVVFTIMLAFTAGN